MTTLFVHIWNHQSELVFEGQSQLRWSVSSKYSYNLHAIYVRCHNIYTHRFDSYPRVRVIVYFILANKRNDCYVHGFNLVVGVTWWSSSNEDEGWDIKPVLQATDGRKGWDFYFQSKKRLHFSPSKVYGFTPQEILTCHLTPSEENEWPSGRLMEDLQRLRNVKPVKMSI